MGDMSGERGVWRVEKCEPPWLEEREWEMWGVTS